jgi:hypothetical protein
MRDRAAWIGSSLLLSSLVLGAGGCKSFKEGFDKEFKSSFAREFGASCAKAAVEKGAPEADAKRGCECLGAFLVEHHSTGELTKLSASPTSEESQKMFAEAAASCRKAPPAPKAP